MGQVAKIAVVAFAKNPISEKYKTRLLDDLQSIECVEKTYELLLKITNQTLVEYQIEAPNTQSFWAMNSEAKDLPIYFSPAIPLVRQGLGPLGERLHTVYQQLIGLHDQVIIIGSDLPFLSKQLLTLTVEKLKDNDLVIGPSDDGGFYLFASKLYFDKNFWTSVEYSQDSTLEQLVGSLKGIQIATLPTLTDIDDLQSFTKAVEILQATSGLSKFQNELVSYFHSEISLLSESFLPNQEDLFFQHKTL